MTHVGTNSTATDWELIHTETDLDERSLFAGSLEVVPTGGDVAFSIPGPFNTPGNAVKILSIK